MKLTTLAACGAALAASTHLANAQGAVGSSASALNDGPSLNLYYETDPAGFKVTSQLFGAEGTAFALVAGIGSTDQNPLDLPVVGFGQLDGQGNGVNVSFVDDDLVNAIPDGIFVRAAYLSGSQLHFTPPADMLLGTATFCELLDFDYKPGDDDLVPGETISNQWDEIGMAVSALNNAPGHPDRGILFDTGNPTGGDFDLATPNPQGFDNTEALGKALIIAENENGVNGPMGLVSNPDDEAAGGSLIFDFEEPATICSVTLLDIDEAPGTELRFYRNGNLVTPAEVMPVLSLGDGSVQTISFLERNVDRFEVYLQGSGAVPYMELVPCPRIIDFDETSTGVPLSFEAGEWITEQYANIGVHVDAVNDWVSGGAANQNHPDKAILFDSGNPTGGDTDLLTPNPQVPGNDEALGFVLIVAEDDVDTSPADGLVDDPDDEASGGDIAFSFDQDVTFLSARVLDVDATEIDYMRFFDEFDQEIQAVLIPDAPDGNVQLISGPISGVRKIVLDLGGSGAITRLRFCPDPVVPGTPQ